MTPWSRPRREPPPLIWRHFCQEWLRLSGNKTEQFWQALTAARWSRAVALRSAILHRAAFPHGRAALDHLVQHTLSPQELIVTLEGLITEQLLAPKTARTIEEAVLARTQKEGGWK
jgi:hypothetical protein